METPVAAYEGEGSFVFVCYAHADSAAVFQEIRWLHDQGINVWYDEGITPGEDWHEVLGAQLSNASHLLFFASPRSVQSKHCLNEIHFAQGRDTTILTIYLEKTPLSPGLQLAIGGSQHVEIGDASFRHRLYAAITGAMRVPQAIDPASGDLPDGPTISASFDGHGGGDAGLFAEGLTEDVGIELARFEELKVLNPEDRNALFTLKGSVRFGQDRVRASATLSHRDGTRVWAERFDESRADDLTAQEQITQRIVAAVVPELERATDALISRGERIFSRPYQLVHEAQASAWLAIHQADHETRRRCLEKTLEAIALDPDCVIAYDFITSYYFQSALFRWDNPDEALQLAEDWQSRFMVHVPQSYLALVSGGIVGWIAKRYDSSLRDLREALELNPNSVYTLRWLAFIEASTGETAAAKQHVGEALRLNPKDPNNPLNYLTLAMAAFLEDDGASFEVAIEKAVRTQPTAPIRRSLAIAWAAETGNREMLDRHRRDIMTTSPDFIPSLLRGDNAPFSRPEHMQKLLDGLRRAGFED